MTLRERILAVYRGETPDTVPFMLDLSHWFYHRHHLPWDLSRSYEKPETALVDYHRHIGAGFYLANLGSFSSVEHADGVQAQVTKILTGGRPEIVWGYATERGRIERRRRWEETTYSWPITAWGVRTEDQLRLLAEALSARRYRPRWDRYQSWVDCVGDTGVVYLSAGYSAMGELLHLWMGVEGVMLAVADWPATMRAVVDQINANNLQWIDLLATSPAEVIILGDNFSSDIQPSRFFNEWSRPYYAEAIRRLHAAGKCAAVHVDGRLRGALRMVAEIGADCADAVTPCSAGDLDPEQCRTEAGRALILSGGIPPGLWLPTADPDSFRRAVRAWLELRRRSPRLIAGAGDQVPPGAGEDRIKIMRDLVEEFGQYPAETGP